MTPELYAQVVAIVERYIDRPDSEWEADLWGDDGIETEVFEHALRLLEASRTLAGFLEGDISSICLSSLLLNPSSEHANRDAENVDPFDLIGTLLTIT